MSRSSNPSKGIPSILSEDDSEDVMEGILDDDEETELSSVSTSPFIQFIPIALAPNSVSQNGQQLGSSESQREKDLHRLTLMARHPNADEEGIQSILKRKVMQEHVAQIAASKKKQLFWEQQEHEDAQHWKEQQEQELLKQQKLRLAQQQQAQQQEHSSLDSLVSQHESTGVKKALDNNDDNKVEHENVIRWQAATGDNDYIDFKNGVDDCGDDDEEKQQNEHQKEPQKNRLRSNNIVRQTRKGISSVFGGASKIFRNVKPLAAADGNALEAPDPPSQLSSSVVTSSDHYTNNTGDSISVNTTTSGDNRSSASGRISSPTSQASVITYKISNIRSPGHYSRSDFDGSIKNNNHLVHDFGNNNNDDDDDDDDDDNDSNDEEKNQKGFCGDWTLRQWILDRKNNKSLICLFSSIIVVAVIITVLAAVYAHRRRVNINASKSLENQDTVDVIDMVGFFPSQSPSSMISKNVESQELSTAHPTEDIEGISIPSNEEIAPQDGSDVESSIISAMMTIMPTAVPTTAPTTLPLVSESPTSSTLLPNTNGPTNLPTVTRVSTSTTSTSTLTKPEFMSWVWSKDEEDGTLLRGLPEIDLYFGQSIALSDDGQTMVVGAPDAADKAGIVRIYKQEDGSWVSVGSLSGRNKGDQFGSAVALSADGRVLAISEPSYNGIAGDKTGNIRTFLYSPFGYISMGKNIEGEGATDQFGIGVALSSDGRRLAVGAPYSDNSNKANDDNIFSSSISGDENRLVSGTVRVFDWSLEEEKWIYIGTGSGGTQLIGTNDLDRFGWSIDLNNDGSLLCVGAPRNPEYGGYVQCFEEGGKDEGINNDSTATQWKEVGNTIRNEDGFVRHDDNFGASVGVSRDPSGTRHRVAIGAPGKNSEDAFDAGHVVVYEFNPKVPERGWIRLGKKVITLEAPGKDFLMGYSLDFHEDLLAVGIPGANDGVGKVEVFKFKKDTWEWLRNPTVFDGVAATGSSSSYGAAISMTTSGDFAVGSPQSNGNVGSVRFHRKKIS